MMSWFSKAKPRVVPQPDAIDDVLKLYILSKSKLFHTFDEIDTNMPLFSSGILDSLAFVELALFVQKTFHATINVAAFDTIAEIRDAILKGAN